MGLHLIRAGDLFGEHGSYRMRKAKIEKLEARRCVGRLVAGAGFEPAAFRL